MLGDQVLVLRDRPEDDLAGMLLQIPELAKERSCFGEVIAVGRGLVLRDGSLATCEVGPGDRVVFPRLAGVAIQATGHREAVILCEDEILGVIE